MVSCGTLGRGVLLALLLGICRPQAAEGAFRGDPVQMFKRMRFGEQRSMWSDVLVGQAPLFQVDRASQLHLPTRDYINSHTAIKLQLSYDHEKLTSEWLTLSDGKGLLLDTLTVIFVYSGSDIKEVHHRQCSSSITLMKQTTAPNTTPRRPSNSINCTKLCAWCLNAHSVYTNKRPLPQNNIFSSHPRTANPLRTRSRSQ